MTAATARRPSAPSPYRSTVPAGRDGFAQLVHAEWTKFRTVRGWVIATAVGVVLMVGFALLTGNGSHSSIVTPQHPEGITGHPYVPLGPGGEPVSDSFTFVHQPLSGDGSITARLTSLAGEQQAGGGPVQPGQAPNLVPSPVQPWAKAGLIIKENTSQGSAYAAIMATGAHGVRMQYDFTGDTAGPAGTVTSSSPRWLRLTRAGDTVTGYTSTDGGTWTKVGAARLPHLTGTVQGGMFATSPGAITFTQNFGGGSGTGTAAAATGTFDNVSTQGNWPAGAWTTGVLGDEQARAMSGSQQAAGVYTITGSGDIAPDPSTGTPVDHVLTGAFAALTVLVVLGVLFVTTEYRRGLLRTSLTVSPRRGRVLAAKAIVVGAVAFVAGLVAAAIAVPAGEKLLRDNGNYIYPVSVLTEARIIGGTAALLAVAAVLALAIGTILRRGAGAVAAAIVVIVLPYILGTAGVLPAGPAEWLLRISPAAAFAIEQSIPAYPQVLNQYTPMAGFFPLAPWAGFAVLCLWAVAAMGLATYLLRRRDA